VRVLSGDGTAAVLHPFGTPYGRRTGAHLVEQFFGLPCHASLQKSGLLLERNHDTLLISSVMKPRRGHYAVFGDLTELFFLIARKIHLCIKAL
jgi:hypothetical protein